MDFLAQLTLIWTDDKGILLILGTEEVSFRLLEKLIQALSAESVAAFGKQSWDQTSQVRVLLLANPARELFEVLHIY